MMRSAMGWLLAWVLAMGAAPAMAQDVEDGGEEALEDANEAVSEDTGDDAGEPEEEASLQDAAGKSRRIRTLQLRSFTKFGRIEISLAAGLIPNDPFVVYLPLGGRVGYHFNESFAVEASGAYLGDGLRVEGDLSEDLVDNGDRTSVERIILLDQQVWRTNVVAVWSPIFGKGSVLNMGLGYFDFNLVGGVGVLQTESPDERDPEQINTNINVEAVLGAGFKFYFLDSFAVRIDFRQFIYPKDRGGTATPSEISIGLSYLTPSL